jgi:dTDP-4-dehydrorhamnose 3,5-epimerase
MEKLKTNISALKLYTPKIFEDNRGYFFEFHKQSLAKELEIPELFVQENLSRSYKGVLRGLHFQLKRPQGKLVTVLSGEVLDVAVDLRPNSPTFMKSESVILSGENHRFFYIPPGFAHGFITLSETADFYYKCTDVYDPTDDRGVSWCDKSLDIEWPSVDKIVSDKDNKLPNVEEILNDLNTYWSEL